MSPATRKALIARTMKKLGLLFKEISENRIKNYLKESENVFIVNYSEISSPDLSTLRQSLRKAHANFFVVKNSVARRAFKLLGFESLLKYIEGASALVFVKEEPVGASRVLWDFSRDHEQLRLVGGFLKDKILEGKDIEALAKLPSKEILRARLVMNLNSPISRLVMVLSGTLRKFVCCLEQIKNKKGN